ncbi:MAG TPA: class I SAM-dependent methyltransferase [Acidimicrobiales bacterium]|nr:class I SAM-dependent methyltransferase [Acidimicrobiales bacterium]
MDVAAVLQTQRSGRLARHLGCGHGWFTNELYRRGAQVLGVDGSEALLDIARSRYPDVPFEQVDLRAGYEGEFDIVVALMVDLEVCDPSTETAVAGLRRLA